MCSADIPEEIVLVSKTSLIGALHLPDSAVTSSNGNSLPTLPVPHASIHRKINPVGISTPKRLSTLNKAWNPIAVMENHPQIVYPIVLS